MKREGHPLLRGGGRGESKYSHGWTTAEMQSLASICEALLPPLTLNSLEGKIDQPTEAVQSFYKASGSQFPIPDEVIILILQLYTLVCLCFCLSLTYMHGLVIYVMFLIQLMKFINDSFYSPPWETFKLLSKCDKLAKKSHLFVIN